jgi:hypothetical protein
VLRQALPPRRSADGRRRGLQNVHLATHVFLTSNGAARAAFKREGPHLKLQCGKTTLAPRRTTRPTGF